MAQDSVKSLKRNCDEIEIRESLKDNIYFAAKDGLSIALYELLSHIKDDHTRRNIINQKFTDDNGQSFTPLVVAARYGRYKVVRMLLMFFAPDLEVECVVKYDGTLVNGATALWCAAGSGYLNIIKLLIQHGADVNHRTKSDSTPVRAACFDGRLDIVKYLIAHQADINISNSFHNTCLMIAAFKGHTDVVEFLLDQGADPNDQADCGATALHYAAECGHSEICSFLLKYDAVIMKNVNGMTPVITAAERTRDVVVLLFITFPGLLSLEDKIEALELLGASFANDKDNYDIDKAYAFLFKAMRMRYADLDNVIRKKLCPVIPAYENWVECQTIQDLEAIRFNHNFLHMESLTIRERILGRSCPEIAHPIIYRGAVCADNGRFDRCESLWLHALELRQGNLLPVQRDLLRFAQVFSQMIQMNVSLRFNNIVKVFSACVVELGRNEKTLAHPTVKDDVETLMIEYELNIFTALYLISIMTKLIKTTEVEPNDIQGMCEIIFTLNKMGVRLRDGQTLLHLAVNGVTPVDDFHTSDVCRFPCAETVKMLLRCGAQAGVFDCDRNTPLHIVVATLQTTLLPVTLKDVIECIELFIAAGVHLDTVNKDGLTAALICPQGEIEQLFRRHESLQINLKCLTARCIARHKINYVDMIPKHLENFIFLHTSQRSDKL